MPITSIGSYEPTTFQFDINWEQANVELAPVQLTLAGNYTRADFIAERAALLTLIERVPDLANEARFTSSERDNARVALLRRANQFRGAVLGKVTDRTYRDDLSTVPKLTSDLSKFCQPLHDMDIMWELINDNQADLALTGPLTLQGDYAQATFAADIEALMVLTNAANRAESMVRFARGRRNVAMDAIYERLKQYRAIVPAELPESSPTLQNLPRLSPHKGSTPPALKAEGAWNEAAQQADLTWEASKAKAVAKIQIRGCVGATYKADEEETVADLAPDATTWSGEWGLTAPGSQASFKAVVMLKDGHENGGKSVEITRPLRL